MLQVRDLWVRYGPLEIVRDVGFEVREGQWLMIVGPNGAGKSTVINAIAQGVAYSGSVTVDGKDLASLKPSQRARKFGVLTQNHNVGYSFTVEEVVRLGRYAYSGGIFGTSSDEDDRMVARALQLTGMDKQARQSVLTLSGGELQRTFLAQVFAQNPQILILDEPANHLDLIYQKHIFSLIQEWLRQPGRAVLSVVHDLSLARKYGTHAVLMHHGKCMAQGKINEVLTPEKLQSVYDMDVYQWMRDLLQQWQ